MNNCISPFCCYWLIIQQTKRLAKAIGGEDVHCCGQRSNRQIERSLGLFVLFHIAAQRIDAGFYVFFQNDSIAFAEERSQGLAPKSVMSMINSEPGGIITIWRLGEFVVFVTSRRRRGINCIVEFRIIAVYLIRTDSYNGP